MMRDDRFTRRGFTQAMITGAAALWVPRVAFADDVHAVTGRFEALGPRRVALMVHNEGEHGVELPLGVAYVVGRVPLAEGALEVRFESEHSAWRRRSRAGGRLRRRMLLAPRMERRYDAFVCESGAGFGAAELALRVALSVRPGDRPVADRPGLAALANIRGSARFGGA